jgi:restriction system protein
MNSVSTHEPDLPDYQTLMLPLLRIAAHGETTIPRAVKRLAAELGLTREQRARKPAGARYAIIHHRAHWAQRSMAKAGLVELPQRGVFRATERGRALLAQNPARIELRMLAAQAARSDDAAAAEAALREQLLDRIVGVADMRERSDAFERLVLDLLVAMGYGGGRKGAAIRLGRTGDGGVDAVIALDPLGVDLLYAQAKCHSRDHAVDVGLVREFSGSLDDKKSFRGVLMTTSYFTKGAQDYVRAIPKPITLVDGAKLARLMIEHGIGVKQDPASARKKLDGGYFMRLRSSGDPP